MRLFHSFEVTATDVRLAHQLLGKLNYCEGASPGVCPPEVQKVVNPVILDDRKYIQNQGLAENISKT